MKKTPTLEELRKLARRVTGLRDRSLVCGTDRSPVDESWGAFVAGEYDGSFAVNVDGAPSRAAALRALRAALESLAEESRP